MLNTEFSPWPSFSEEEADAVKKVLLSNRVNYWTGQECRKFENEFAEFSESKFAVAVMNGTVALDLCLKGLNISKGKEVIVTSRTFLASVSSIVNAGAIPVFVDVSKDTQNITEASIRKAITANTAAILCVHLAGWPCDMDEIIKISREFNLSVIEDCAQAHGAMYKGKSVGGFGDVAAWSFCQDKIMTTGGEGGMVTTNSESLWNRMWSYKDHGKSYDAVYNRQHPPGFRWLHESFGTNWRMTELQAVIGRIQLKRMTQWTEKRNEHQNQIWNACRQILALRVPDFACSSCAVESCKQKTKTCVHAAYKCYVFVEQEKLKDGWSRDRIIKEVSALGVPCFSGSCSEVYLEKAFEGESFVPETSLPNAKELGDTSLMFLVHPTLDPEEISKTCDVIKKVMVQAAK